MGLDGFSGHGGKVSVVWGTEGREFKSPQPDHKNGPETLEFRAILAFDRCSFGRVVSHAMSQIR